MAQQPFPARRICKVIISITIFCFNLIYLYEQTSDLYEFIGLGEGGTHQKEIAVPSQPKHQYFSNLTRNLERGAHFLTTFSGCRMAAWVYHPYDEGYGLLNDCHAVSTIKRLQNASQLHVDDTIYVTFIKLDHFVENLLDDITVDVVVLTGQQQAGPPPQQNTIDRITNSSHITRWFCMSLSKFGGENPYHPKISPFPYGLKEVVIDKRSTWRTYREVFMNQLNNGPTKRNGTSIFAGHLDSTNPKRQDIPKSRSLPPAAYFNEIAKYQYILSPDGDRPECYRHYEALGLGTVPITELDPALYRHLNGGPVIYNNTDWNLTKLQEKLAGRSTMANKNMVFEEYWMEYVEIEVGHPLRWWDRNVEKVSTLAAFSN